MIYCRIFDRAWLPLHLLLSHVVCQLITFFAGVKIENYNAELEYFVPEGDRSEEHSVIFWLFLPVLPFALDYHNF